MTFRTCFFSAAAIIFLTAPAAAQDAYLGTVTVFSEAGENFTLFLNGDQKNTSPAVRVVAANITEVPVSFRIVFESEGLKELKKNGLRNGKDCIYAIEKNKKGEHILKIKNCTGIFNSADGSETQMAASPAAAPSISPGITTPAQLSASYANGIITINDGRTLPVTKIKATGMTYPRLIMAIPQGAKVSIKYDDNTEQYTAEIPFQYEVKDFSNNNSFFTLTVDEGGSDKTWHVKLQNSNGFDLKIE